MIRLNKYIAMSGICSRRKADELIENGRVSVNGSIIYELGIQINEECDVVEVMGRKIELEEEKVYIMLNKPRGYITTNDEQFSRPSTIDLIHEHVRVFPIGRLDMNTEGLLLLTNDGEFANKLTHPRHEIEKTYEVETRNNVEDEMIQKLRNGVDIEGYITKPAKVEKLSNKKIEIIISEGKNKQVRRMCEAVNIELIYLRRIKIGNLGLGDLKLGEYRRLSISEIKNI